MDVSDDFLEQLDKASVEDRTAFLGERSDDERAAIFNAVPLWQARKKTGELGVYPRQIPASAPPSDDGNMGVHLPGQGVGQEPLSPYATPGAGTHGNATFAPQTQSDEDTQQLVKETLALPDTIHKGAMRGSEAIVGQMKQPGMVGPGIVAPGVGPVGELLARSALSNVAGQDIMEAMPEGEKLEAVNSMEGTLGTRGTAAALAASQFASDPMNLLGFGWAKKAEQAVEAVGALKKATPLVKKLAAGVGSALGSGAEGAVVGATKSVVAGESPVAGAATGAGMGFGFGALGAAGGVLADAFPKYWKAAVKEVPGIAYEDLADRFHPIAVYGKEKIRELALSIASLMPESPHVDPLSPQAIHVPLKDLNPSVIVLHNDGQNNFARVTEARNGEIPRVHELPIDTEAQALVVRDYMKQKGVKAIDGRANTGITEKIPENILRIPFEREKYIGKHGEEILVKNSNLMATNPGTRAADVDANYHPDDSSRQMIVVDDHGVAKMEFDAPAIKPEGSPHDIWDPVIWHRPDGDVLAAVTGFSPEGKPLVMKMPETSSPSSVTGTENVPYGKTKYFAPQEVGAHELSAWKGTEAQYTEHIGKNAAEAAQAKADRVQAGIAMMDYFKHSPVVIPKIVAKQSGVPIETVIQTLHQLESARVVKKVGDAQWVWKRRPQSAPVYTQFRPGDSVFTNEAVGPNPARGDLAHTGVIKDIAAGKALVDMGNGVTKEIPLAKIFPAKDNIVGIPDPPDAGPPPKPGQVDDSSLEQVNAIANLTKALSKRGPNVVEHVMNGLIDPYFRAGPDLADKILKGYGAKELQNAPELFGAFQKRFKRAPFDGKLDQTLSQVLDGKISLKDMELKYPQEVEHINQFVRPLLDEVEANHTAIEQEAGMAPGELGKSWQDGDATRYGMRMYRSHFFKPGEWAKLVAQNSMEDVQAVTRLLMNDLKNKGYTYTEGQVASKVLDIIGVSKEEAGASGGPVEEAWKHLTARKDIHPAIRRVMGEETSGMLRFSTTLASQRGILENLRIWNGIAGDPKSWRPGDPTGGSGDWVQVPDNKQMFGKASGGYVPKVVAEALIPVANASRPGAVMRMVQGLNSWSKFNEVPGGGFGPWINNFLGNIPFSLYAGGLDPFKPHQFGIAFKNAVKELHSYKKAPVNRGLVFEARQDGALSAGFGATEMGGLSNKLLDVMKESLDKLPADATIWDLSGSIYRDTRRFFKGFKEKVTAAYDWIDQSMKLANYISLRQKFQSQGMSVADSRALAAYRINQSFPNPAHVGKVVDSLSKNIGIGAKYLRFYAETARINSMLPGRMVSEPEMRMQAMKVMLWGGALASGMTAVRRMNGITDEEAAAVQAQQSKKQRAFKALQFVSPVRDSKGRAFTIDMTPYFDPAKYLTGHPDDSVIARIGQNVLMAPFGDESYIGEKIKEGMERMGMKRAFPGPRPLREGEQGFLSLMEQAWKEGMAPKGVLKIKNVLQKYMANPTPMREQPTAGQTAGQALGFPIGTGSTVGGPDRYSNFKQDYKQEVYKLKSDFKSVIRDQQLSPEHKAELYKANIERRRLLSEQQRILNQMIEAARNSKGPLK